MRETYLSNTLIKDISHLVVKNPTKVYKSESIEKVLKAITNDLRTRHAYVVDENDVLIGSIRVNHIIQYLFPTIALLENRDIPKVGTFMEFYNAKMAEDIMETSPSFVYQNSTLSDLVNLMIKEEISEIPVLDENKKLIGEANILEIIMHHLNSEKE